MADRLRELWDFADLDGTEARFRARLNTAETDDERAEVLTQLARVEGLRDNFAAGHALVDEAEALVSPESTGRVRALLERGRLHRSGGDPEAAQPLFVAAFVLAKKGGDLWFAADAAHMVALVDDPEKWTQVGLDLISEHPELEHWLGPLHNNLGWYYFENERYDDALAAFEKTPAPYAAYGRAKTLALLGRSAEAADAARQALELLPEGSDEEFLAEMTKIAGPDD
ncbi:tetratricopeptide repeat protein [Lentzea aerocolonigenes]|uniref:tetratricopeptide repeat protein n=1 Tax=Lentzea aerocolonigenes TaxID=68170 RepID=UPI0006975D96|nr:tetratricopeptide repeat protein [Lentzea aerocolonigenes]